MPHRRSRVGKTVRAPACGISQVILGKILAIHTNHWRQSMDGSNANDERIWHAKPRRFAPESKDVDRAKGSMTGTSQPHWQGGFRETGGRPQERRWNPGTPGRGGIGTVDTRDSWRQGCSDRGRAPHATDATSYPLRVPRRVVGRLPRLLATANPRPGPPHPGCDHGLRTNEGFSKDLSRAKGYQGQEERRGGCGGDRLCASLESPKLDQADRRRRLALEREGDRRPRRARLLG